MSSISGHKTSMGNVGGGGGGGALSLYELKNITGGDITISSTSYINVTNFNYVLPNDGKKYLVIIQVSCTNESGVANQVYVALYDGTTDGIDERSWYNAGLSASFPIEVCSVFAGTGQTIQLRAKVSNNNCRFANSTIYGRSKVVVITIA